MHHLAAPSASSPTPRRSATRTRAVWLLALAALLALTSACSGGFTDRSRDGLRTLTAQGFLPSSSAWDALADNDLNGAAERWETQRKDASTPQERAWSAFGQAEVDFITGRYDSALKHHAEVVTAAPWHPLAQWSLMRLVDLHGLAPNPHPTFVKLHKAVRDAAAKPDAPQKPAPLTRYLANTLALYASADAWSRSDNPDPFKGDAFGTPTLWRVAGPTSHHPHLDIDNVTRLEQDASLRDSYTLLGFPRRTEYAHTTSPIVYLDALNSGVYVAETWLKLDATTRFDVAGTFAGLAVVRIDGQTVLTRDDREAYPPAKQVARDVILSEGWHRVTVRLGYIREYKTSFGLTFIPQDPNTALTFTTTPPPTDRDMGEVEQRGRVAPWIGDPYDLDTLGDDPAALYLAAWMATELREEPVARAALDRLAKAHPDFVGAHMIRAGLSSTLWSLPSRTRRRDALIALKAARKAAPDAAHATLTLAKALRNQDLRDDAKAALNALLEARPDQAAVWQEAAAHYRWRGFDARAEAALKRAAELDPNDCGVAKDLLAAWLRRDFMPSDNALPEPWRTCDLFAYRYAEARVTAGADPQALLDDIALDITRYPGSLWPWTSLARATYTHRGPDAALAVLNRAVKAHPDASSLHIQRAEIFFGRGDRAKAQEAVRAALEASPNSVGARRLAALLQGVSPLHDLQASGPQAIRDYEAKPPTFKSSAAYVLDYMARRYFSDGSSVDLTHIIVHVRDRDGLNTYGEVRLPSGALPLWVRTIKRGSGAVIEPAPPSGKPIISMPSLDVGDYVEYAYLSYNGRWSTRQGAFIGADFYFKMKDIASARSEFVVEYPKSWSPTVVRRNFEREGTYSEHDGRARLRFVRTASDQPRPEPRSVPNAEHLPHVQLIHRYSWKDSQRALQEGLASARALSPLLIKRAREVVQGVESDTDRARALFDFVKRHVRNRSFGDFSTDAAFVERTGEGNPVVLLSALLEAVAIPSEVWRIKSVSKDPVETDIPALGDYSFTALRVQPRDGAPLWLNPVGPNARFNYLPRYVQNAPAISLEPGASIERLTTPAWPDEIERRDVTMDLQLDASGDLSGTVTETLRGYRAIARRNRYDSLASEDALRKFVERIVGYEFNGAALLGYTIDNRDDPDADLVLTYRFKLNGYARPTAGGGLSLKDRYDLLDITRTFATLPERTVPMLINARTDERVRITLTAPLGWTLAGPGGSDAYTQDSAFGAYTRTIARPKSNTLTIEHRLVIPIQRIAPADYADFVSWAGDIDRATYGRLEAAP